MKSAEFWFDGRMVSEEEYLDRVCEIRERADALNLSKTWIARKVRRSRPHVSAVLNGRNRGPKTLLLIEQVVERIEAGELMPK